MMESLQQKHNMQQLIGTALRVGVMTACSIALVSGLYYLISHGMEPMPDYRVFHGEPSSLTTLGGIWGGLLHFEAKNWIQLGVLVLMLTPIVRILLSLIDFAREKDWLYVSITAIVFLVIIANSVGGV
jgi:uncharacterized membrane protein